MDKDIKSFIEKMKVHNVDKINQFANQFTQNAYDVFIKLRDGQPLTMDEFDIALIEHNFDKYMMIAVVSAPHMPIAIKDQVVDNLIAARRAGISTGYSTNVLNETLKHYKNIPDKTLEKLFVTFHAPIMSLLCNPTVINDEMCKIPQLTIDKLLKLEIKMLNGEITMPSGVSARTGCFRCVNNKAILEYILNNMPPNARDAEMVATYLINSPHIDNDTKNRIFDKYGCDVERLQMATPYIADTVYMSVAETVFPNTKTKITREDAQYQKEGKQVLECLLSESLLSETMQTDLANRAIYDSAERKSKKSNDIILAICEYTKNPNVLNFIVMESNNYYEIEKAIENKHASDNTIRFYAHYFCEKIEDKYRKGKEDTIPDRWIDNVAHAMERTTINEYDYDTILKSKDIYVIETAIKSLYTPEKILDKIAKIVNEKYDKEKSNDWMLQKINIAIRRALKDTPWNTQEHFDIILQDFERLRKEYFMDASLKTASITTGHYKKNIKLAENFAKIIEKAVVDVGYKPKGATPNEFANAVREFMNSKMELFYVKPEKDIHEMNSTELQKKKENVVKQFFDYILHDNPKCYFELKEMAKEYNEIAELFEEKIAEERQVEEKY